MGGEDADGGEAAQEESARPPHVPGDSTAQLVSISPFTTLQEEDHYFCGTALEKCVLEGLALTPQQLSTAHRRTYGLTRNHLQSG